MIYCHECHANSGIGTSEEEAIAAWNKRTPDWEQRYGELVETVAKRTDQAGGKK